MATFTRPPVELALGESFSWVSSFASRSASDGWACSVYFRGPEEVDVVGVVDGSSFSFAFTTSTFGRAGAYEWQAIATKAAERIVVDGGKLWLLANLEESTNLGDQATHADRMVSRLEAALEGGDCSALPWRARFGEEPPRSSDVAAVVTSSAEDAA